MVLLLKNFEIDITPKINLKLNNKKNVKYVCSVENKL